MGIKSKENYRPGLCMKFDCVIRDLASACDRCRNHDLYIVYMDILGSPSASAFETSFIPTEEKK